MELLGPVDFIISGWECQGFLTIGFREGLSDTRSDLFMDMVRLITWVQSIFLRFGYVIENTPSRLDQREKVQEHYTLVKHYFGEPLPPNAAQWVFMRTDYATGGPTLHHFKFCNWL
jgi:site-specific DNA-cytosine methylase